MKVYCGIEFGDIANLTCTLIKFTLHKVIVSLLKIYYCKNT